MQNGIGQSFVRYPQTRKAVIFKIAASPDCAERLHMLKENGAHDGTSHFCWELLKPMDTMIQTFTDYRPKFSDVKGR